MAFDEEYWQPSPQWVKPSNIRLFVDPDEIPAASLFVSVANLSQEPVEIVIGSSSNVLATQLVVEILLDSPHPLDEGLWRNPTAPVEAKLYQRLPLGDPEEVPAGSFLVSPSVEEEYWQNPVRPVPASLYRSPCFTDPDETPSLFTPQVVQDEYWQNSVAPVPATEYERLPLGDPEEIPAATLLVSDSVWEDYWQNPVRPIPAQLYRSPILGDREEVPAGSLTFSINLTQEPVEIVVGSSSNVLATQFVVEIVSTSPKQVEDEYWLNWVGPKVATLYQRLPLGDPEEIPAATLLVAPSVWEDYWQNPVRPVPAKLYRSPAWIDPEELPHLVGHILLTQFVVEIVMGYQYQVYTGWTGTSMSVS